MPRDGYGVEMPLGAKVRVPPPRRALLERARLANPFASKEHLPRLVLLAAPPGFGKTTLLTQWLAELGVSPAIGPSRIAWLTLDESDTDIRQFLSDLVDSLARGDATTFAEAHALLGTGRPVATEVLLASVINELEIQEPTVIALDDFHRAVSPDVHQAVAFLLENLPPQVVVAMTTRADPRLPLARMRTRGELVELRADDLRFTAEESGRFLRVVMNVDLDPAQVGVLEAKTEGWVAGLQLAALSVRSRALSGDAVDDFIRDFRGSHRFILDYLVEEVLDAQTIEDREFLLVTSVLDHMTGPLCDMVTDATGGQSQLERLEAANVFVTALDEERRWFRYHQLFAEALRARLNSERPGQLAPLHLAASRGYASLGLLDDALDQAVRAAAPGWLADLTECALPSVRKRRRDRQLLQWINLLPDDIVRHRPVLATTRAWSRLVVGDLAAARTWLDVSEGALGTEHPESEPQHLAPDLRAVLDGERRAAAANIAIYRAAIAQAEGDLPQTIRQAELAGAAAPGDHFIQGASAGFLGLAAWAAGDLPLAIDTFRDAVAHMAAAGDITDQFGATVVQAEMALSDGRVNDAKRLYERAIESADQNQAAAAMVAGDLHTGLAGVLVERDQMEEASGELQLAWSLGESASLQENRFRWHAVNAALLRSGADLDAALEQLDTAERLYLPGFFPEIRPFAAIKARVLIAGGRLSQARQWAAGADVEHADSSQFLREYELLTYARLVVAEHSVSDHAETGELDRVLRLLERIIDQAAAAQRRGSVVEAHLVRALALSAAGQADQADDALRASLHEGVPSGYVRLFLDAGPAVKDLLRRHVASGRTTDTAVMARRLLDRSRAPAGAPFRPAVAEPLSERELEVLRLMASDLTGPEIASRLFVSINTLRTHSKHIFTKLEATTRRAAVARGRERGLL